MNSFKSTTNNPWFGISMALVGAIVGYGIAIGTGTNVASAPSQPSQVAQQPNNPVPTQPPPPPPAGDIVPIDKEIDHIRGNPNAKVSVIEYSDYECPFCGRHHPTMQQIMDEYGDDVNWVYRHFPLNFHPNAQMTAEAAECVNEQGGNDAFWAYTDMLFEKGVAGKTKDDFIAYAGEVGVDTDAFVDCLDSGKYTQHVKDDMAGGSAAGVSGTPGNIIVNNETGEKQLVSGAQPFTNFQSVIDQYLK